MSRFYVSPNCVKDNKIYIGKRESRHIKDVMRLKKNDRIVAFDGTGKEYYGVIDSFFKNSVIIKIEKTEESRSDERFKIILAQAIPKMGKMDYIIQKTTELGVSAIIPMNTERTIVRLNKENFEQKQKRWEKIAREAAKQCGRNSITEIEESLAFYDLLQRLGAYDLSLMPCVSPDVKGSLKESISGFCGKSILVLIGPEGGFTQQEIDAALEKGVNLISLGKNILRCETAACASIAIVNHELRNL